MEEHDMHIHRFWDKPQKATDNVP